MKLAALADIHGNYRALLSVVEDLEKWNPDLVFVAGDLINRGPRSRECLEFILGRIQTADWQVVKGNHELYVLKFDQPQPPGQGPEYQVQQFIHWCYQQLTADQIQAVKELPGEINLELPGSQQVRTVHASMAGFRTGIYPHTPQEEIGRLIHPGPDLIMIGHTHKPLICTSGKTTVVNAGSVGFPFDRDSRPSYARIRKKNSSWGAKVVRVDYDHQEAVNDLYQTGFIPQAGPLAEIILEELKQARPLLSRWKRCCQQSVLAGETKLETSVRRFLNSLDDH